mgnify:CR=1 FL=1
METKEMSYNELVINGFMALFFIIFSFACTSIPELF